MPDVTQILNAAAAGEPHAAGRLLAVVYDELRELAAARLAQEKPGQTLSPTALVHEAWLRLVPAGNGPSFDNRAHFFAAAAEAMRRILVDNARRKNRMKRGGGLRRVNLADIAVTCELPVDDIVAVSEALEALAREAPQKAELVKLRYFAGLSLEETADALAISRATAARHWAYARAWLYDRLTRTGD
jgi:RNA polymerase sigma factor (TIGR02999 family)